jgi:hypothetical protein
MSHQFNSSIIPAKSSALLCTFRGENESLSRKITNIGASRAPVRQKMYTPRCGPAFGLNQNTNRQSKEKNPTAECADRREKDKVHVIVKTAEAVIPVESRLPAGGIHPEKCGALHEENEFSAEGQTYQR